MSPGFLFLSDLNPHDSPEPKTEKWTDASPATMLVFEKLASTLPGLADPESAEGLPIGVATAV